MRLIDADALTESLKFVLNDIRLPIDIAANIEMNIDLAPTEEPQIIRCKDCIYYDPPHIENNGKRYEYKDMPKEAFDPYQVDVSVEFGINVGGRCCVDYNVGYVEDKRVFVNKDNYCGRAVRMEVDNE